MKMSADPLLVAVALGMLSPTVFEVDDDVMGEVNPPPMLERTAELVAEQVAEEPLSNAVITAEELSRG